MLKITTPCFDEGGWIPDRNSGFGEDKSPEFHIEGIDAKVETMVITLDDLGHPLQPGYNHWIAWNIPPVECIPSGIAKGSVMEDPIHIEQGLAYGKHRYRGPKPPFNWNHEYLFTLYMSGRNGIRTRGSSTWTVEMPCWRSTRRAICKPLTTSAASGCRWSENDNESY